MPDFLSWRNPFMYAAVFFAVLYGLRVVPIFLKPVAANDNDEDGKRAIERYKKFKTWRRWDWWFHQVWLNALGQVTGWVVMYYIWNKAAEGGIESFGIGHYIALIIAFLGVWVFAFTAYKVATETLMGGAQAVVQSYIQLGMSFLSSVSRVACSAGVREA